MQLEAEETEETEDAKQCLDEEKCTGVEKATAISKWHRVARDVGLAASLSFGYYPEFVVMQGSSQDLNTKECSPFDVLSLAWLASLCALIAMETNRYVCEKGTLNWHDMYT